MVSRTVNLKDFANEIGEFTEDRLAEYKHAAIIGIAKSVPDLVKSSPVDTGRYAASWDMTIGEKNVILGNYAPHAPIIEIGARPFTPPIGPLLAWAKRVLQDASQPPEYSSAVWGLARYTQMKIEREGMKPRHILENAMPNILQHVRSEFKKL